MVGGRDDVSRETRARLDILIRELSLWQRAVNLVSPASLADVERRHVADSLQLLTLVPPSGAWVDLGSGAGFPGLVIAAADPTRSLTLIESDSRKCAFLRHAAAAMDVAPEIREARVEAELMTGRDAAVVSARALAPLGRLLGYAQPLLARGAVGLFPKGRSFATELTEAQEHWHFHVDVIESSTDSDGRVLRISGFEGRRS